MDRTDIFRYRSLSGGSPTPNHGSRHQWNAPRSIKKSKDGRRYMESDPEVLDIQALGASDDGRSS